MGPRRQGRGEKTLKPGEKVKRPSADKTGFSGGAKGSGGFKTPYPRAKKNPDGDEKEGSSIRQGGKMAPKRRSGPAKGQERAKKGVSEKLWSGHKRVRP